jgi:hypothetical protein
MIKEASGAFLLKAGQGIQLSLKTLRAQAPDLV